MVRCTLSGLWKWMLTKVTLAVAAIFLEKQQMKSAEHTNKVKDSMKDKTKSFLSGSKESKPVKEDNTRPVENNNITVVESDDFDRLLNKIEMISKEGEVDIEAVEEALQKILDSDWGSEILEEAVEPIFMLDLNKDQEMLYSVSRRTFVPVKNKLEVIPIQHPVDKGRTNFFLVNNEVFDIDPEKVVEIGWN
jgi:hypothetical protein